MAAELALKDKLVGDMEEHLNDLKEKNKTFKQVRSLCQGE